MLFQNHSRAKRKLSWCSHIAVIACVLGFSSTANAVGSLELVPAVKQCDTTSGVLDLSTCRIDDHDGLLASEANALTEFLLARSIAIKPSGILIRLQLGNVELPSIQSAYAEAIHDQAYVLRIDSNGVTIRGRTPAGVFYGIQTLRQLVDDTFKAPHIEIVDWPDLAFRGVMVDPARANENTEYYERLIEFCGRYKLNRIHLHLTDDQSVTLYHERYPSLMHPHAWRTEELQRLIQYARRLHIELIPEIESLGHARVFLQHPEFDAFLHRTEENRPAGDWIGTTQVGYTNVLCPASERAATYLADMYARAASAFPYRMINLGCDEVDMTRCSRCVEAFPGISTAEWFRQHLQHCQALAARLDRRVGVWGDMLLRHPRILDGLSPKEFVIFDWHYEPEVSEKSVVLFQDRGFEVIGCPALMCHPHMILPSTQNLRNIRRFAEIARKRDLRGIDTTIWIPTRYLSDALWTGVAYASAQAWSGSRSEDTAFFSTFARDFFGLPQGNAFAAAYERAGAVEWGLNRFRLSCWFDDESLAAAKNQVTGELRVEAERFLAELRSVSNLLADLSEGVTANRVAWDALDHSVAIMAYTIEHFLAAADVENGLELDRVRLRRLDKRCVEAIEWIQTDWDRNRFADDPGKADIHKTDQHLLHRFRQMHTYHLRTLANTSARP